MLPGGGVSKEELHPGVRALSAVLPLGTGAGKSVRHLV